MMKMNDESSLAIRHQHHYMLILTKIVINERVFLVFVYNYYSSAQHVVFIIHIALRARIIKINMINKIVL